MYGNQKQHRFFTLQGLEAENRKQMQEEQEKRNHDTMKSEVKKFFIYVFGLDSNSLVQSKETNLGLFKLSNAMDGKQNRLNELEIEDVDDFFDIVSFLTDILSSYDKKQEAVECFKELALAYSDTDFDKAINSLLGFYKKNMSDDFKQVVGEKWARNQVDCKVVENNNNKQTDNHEEIEANNDNTIIVDEDKKNGEDKSSVFLKRCEKLLSFKDNYKTFDLFNLNIFLSNLESCLIDGTESGICLNNGQLYEKLFAVMTLYLQMSDFFLKTAQSDVDKLLIDGCKSCRLLDTNIENISDKISKLGENNLTNKNEYQAKIKFLEQSINANIRGDSLSSARIRGLYFVVATDIQNMNISINDNFYDYSNDKKGNGQVEKFKSSISGVKKKRNLFINEMLKIRSLRQKMSVQAINELREINKSLDKKCDEETLNKLKELPKTVNVEHSIKTGFLWLWYKFLNWFINNKQITPQNSLNDQIGAVVRQRFSQFKQADFIIPLNSLIIRSLGIEPDGEQYEIESLFNNTFTAILLPMLNNDLDGQIGSLADALYNVIPQNQNDAQNNSFNGVKYAISQYISDAMVECWVETIFDFIRMDSADTSVHLSRRNHTFDADMYFNNLKDNENRKSRFKEILHDRFSESLSKIVADIEGAIKDGNNDHEICECLLKCNIGLLDFCNKLHDRNSDQLGEYLQNSIARMTPAAKDVLSNLQLNLKFSIFNCRSENEDKAPEKPNKDFLNNLLVSPNKTEYKDAVASKEAFLNNLSPSSKKAYEQSEVLAKESVNDSKLHEKEEHPNPNIDLPNAYKNEYDKKPTQWENRKIIIS